MFQYLHSSHATIVDVRTTAENEAGSILARRLVHIPHTEVKVELSLSEDEFLEKYGIDKPEKDQTLVLFCQAGVRSEVAANLAEEAGFTDVVNYKGGWKDWSAN